MDVQLVAGERRWISNARRLNSMEVQEFQKAADLSVRIGESLAKSESRMVDVDNLHQAQSAAKEKSAEVVESAKDRIAPPEGLFADSDVEVETRDEYVTAAGTVEHLTEGYPEKSVRDWVGFVQALETAVSTAQQAVKQAQTEISEAEAKRAKAARAAAARRRRTNSTYTSTGGSSTRSTSSFRPGGGRFGGGGAGGKY